MPVEYFISRRTTFRSGCLIRSRALLLLCNFFKAKLTEELENVTPVPLDECLYKNDEFNLHRVVHILISNRNETNCQNSSNITCVMLWHSFSSRTINGSAEHPIVDDMAHD
jgi:hypothetical protein